VSTALVGSPTVFNTLYDVTYTPFPFNAGSNAQVNSSQVTLGFTNADLQSLGVASITFTFFSNGIATNTASENGGQLIQEIDVLGTAAIPEPSNSAMVLAAALASWGLLRRNRRKE
jgi:hypothetical protein